MNPPPVPNQLSFLPEDFLERKARRRANILCGLLSVIVIGAIGSAFIISERSMRGVEAQFAEVDARYSKASQQIEAVQRMHTKQRQIVQHAELAAALVERVPRSNVLAEFTNNLPPGVSLLELWMESKPRQAAGPAPGASSFDQKRAALEAAKGKPEVQPLDAYIKITGLADNEGQVSQFMSRLNASKLMTDVNLLTIEPFAQDKATMKKFQIEMRLNPDAEVREGQAASIKSAAVDVGEGK
jgi:Tfp pilus assembly protein PilN